MNTLEKLNILCEKNSIDLKKDFRLHTNVKITNAYRLLLQLYYAMSISKVNNGKYDDLLDYVVENVSQYYNKQGAFPLEFVNETEKSLNAMQEDAKSYKYICIGHAHIDMNWLWGINETVSITHDTFRTVLDLMNQYPEFTFAQSQASVYHIMEQYFPEMIDEVKQRVKEGRWEVTASTWVEADRNMPNAESIARQLLYAKKYLSELLDIDPKSLNVDFEPDTFGHNANTPEILSQGGVKYYYHCRGYEEETLYRWQSKSGQKITSFCEPIWYNHTITGQRALMLAEFCEKNNMDSLLCVYGVGDHGGGPTRRDIERIIKMNTWPIFPEWKFGTFADFYALTDEVSDTLPVVDSELNFVFTGCYTSQSLIKKNNKKNEQDLKITEMWNTIAKNAIGAPYTNKGYEENWRMVMFNQFHDILPGSGIAATRHHASSLAQQVRGFTEISTNRNLRALSDNINTKNLVNEQDLTETISEGAGSGFGLNAKSGVQYSRHSGIERIFTVFNSLPYQRKEPVEITLWDWWGDQERIYFEDSDGNMIKHQLVVIGKSIYWGHFYHTYLVEVDVSATGYNTIIAKQHDEVMLPTVSFPQRRVNKHEPMVLENENIKAIFDNKARIVSLIDKSTGVDFADDQVIGLFRMITEDPSRGETAWVVGRYMDINDLEDNVKVTEVKTENVELRQSISFSMDVGESSSLMVSASLDNESHRIDFNVQCRWTEIGTKEDGVPQLQINVPVAYECDDFTYDIPLGYEYRKGMSMDVPAQSFALANNKDGKSLVLVSDCKYGYRGDEKGLVIDLIRSTFGPDPFPEVADHQFMVSLAIVDDELDAKKQSQSLCEPFVSVSATSHEGTLPTEGAFVEVLSGNIVIDAYKVSENDKNKMVLRLYSIDLDKSKVQIKMQKPIKQAYFVNILEELIEGKVAADKDIISFDLEINKTYSIMIEFA